LTPGDPDRLQSIILDYYEHPDKGRLQGENALASARTVFGRTESTKRYRLALEALVAAR
jgi:hypothetical protein